MSNRIAMAAALVAALVVPGALLAHEGHAHKVLGTVASRHENHLEVQATDGKRTTITLDDKTRILRGKTKVGAEDIKTGERVVVTAIQTKGKDGKTTMVASEVRLAAPGL
jgi:hypothetical protein